MEGVTKQKVRIKLTKGVSNMKPFAPSPLAVHRSVVSARLLPTYMIADFEPFGSFN